MSWSIRILEFLRQNGRDCKKCENWECSSCKMEYNKCVECGIWKHYTEYEPIPLICVCYKCRENIKSRNTIINANRRRARKCLNVPRNIIIPYDILDAKIKHLALKREIKKQRGA
jgi:hypothetical protein